VDGCDTRYVGWDGNSRTVDDQEKLFGSVPPYFLPHDLGAVGPVKTEKGNGRLFHMKHRLCWRQRNGKKSKEMLTGL